MSPFLFIIAMKLLTKDAKFKLSARATAAFVCNDLGEVLYADDTLIMGSCAFVVAEHAVAIEQAEGFVGVSDRQRNAWETSPSADINKRPPL